jgi:polysaccharide biosynthesis protein PslA
MNAPFVRQGRTSTTWFRVRALARARAKARALRMPLMPSLQRRRAQCYLALMLVDIAMLFAGFAIAGGVSRGLAGMPQALDVAQIVLPAFLTAALYGDAYAIDSLQHAPRAAMRVLGALIASGTIVVFFVFYTKANVVLSRLDLTLGMAITAMLLGLGRLQMARFVKWHCGPSAINELVIQDDGPQISLPNSYHVSAQSFGLVPNLSDPHALDRIGMILRNADRVIVSAPAERHAQWAVILRGANVQGEVVDDSLVNLAAHGARIVNGSGLLLVSDGPLGIRARMAKRLFDVVVAATALLLLSPILILAAMLIKAEDGGSVFFLQRRVGRSNRFFSIYKFRSMTENLAGVDGDQSASKADKRVTRVGSFIRKTSIDELPQLFNVLKGDMSLVGPRPHAIGSRAAEKLFWEIDSRYWQRHALKPGLTGLAQIRGYRGATEKEEHLSLRLASDLEYLHGWSLMRDVWIMAMTLKVLVHDRAF